MSEQNKQRSRQILEQVFSEGRVELVDEILAPSAVGHDPALPTTVDGPDGLKQAVQGYRAAFPDLRVTVEEQVADGDRVATRWSARGTHKGDLFGLSPTGKEGTVTGITIDRFEGGKVVESWTNWDTLGLMQQLGIVPSMAMS